MEHLIQLVDFSLWHVSSTAVDMNGDRQVPAFMKNQETDTSWCFDADWFSSSAVSPPFKMKSRSNANSLLQRCLCRYTLR